MDKGVFSTPFSIYVILTRSVIVSKLSTISTIVCTIIVHNLFIIYSHGVHIVHLYFNHGLHNISTPFDIMYPYHNCENLINLVATTKHDNPKCQGTKCVTRLHNLVYLLDKQALPLVQFLLNVKRSRYNR